MPRKNSKKTCPHCGDVIWFNSTACGSCAARRRVNDDTRACSSCQTPMPRATRGGYCRDCRREYNRDWRKRNPDKVAAAQERGRERRADPENWQRELARRREQYWANAEKQRKYNREWARANKDSRRATDMRKRYGLEPEEWKAILARGCAICRTHKGKLCIDHDHKNGKVRDALCGSCNSALGLFADDLNRVRAAVAYLEEHAPQNA